MRKEDGERDKRGGRREKKEFVPQDNLHPDVKSVRTDIYNMSTLAYFGDDDSVNLNRSASIIGVDVQGEFDPESSSVEISEL